MKFQLNCLNLEKKQLNGKSSVSKPKKLIAFVLRSQGEKHNSLHIKEIKKGRGRRMRKLSNYFINSSHDLIRIFEIRIKLPKEAFLSFIDNRKIRDYIIHARIGTY